MVDGSDGAFAYRNAPYKIGDRTNNIAAATDPRSRPVWRVGADGIGEWIFRADASPTPSPSPSQSPLANNPPPSPPPRPRPSPPPGRVSLLAKHIAKILLERGVSVSIERIEKLLGKVGFIRLLKLLTLSNYDFNRIEKLIDWVETPAQLERLLTKVGDASKLEELMRSVGYDASKLEELLSLVGNDASKLERLLSRVYNDVNNLERLLKLSPAKRTHILDGEGNGKGGHGPGRGIPDKSEFPSSWSDEQVINNIHDVLIDTNSTWKQVQGISGARYYSNGNPMRWEVEGNRYSVRIRIVVEPDGEGIITAYPPDIPRNP